MHKWRFVVLLLVGATILGATVLREPVAWATQNLAVTITGPVDEQGNVMVPVEPNAHLTNRYVFAAQVSLDSGPVRFTVPAGKVLIVDHLNVWAIGDSNKRVTVGFQYTAKPPVEGDNGTLFFDAPLLPGSVNTDQNLTQYGYDGEPALKMWPGDVYFNVGHDDGAHVAEASVRLTGYFVKAP